MSLSIDDKAQNYLDAIGAAAIYVITENDRAVSVGISHSPAKALRHIQRIISPAAYFGWIAWAANYDELLAIAKTPDLTLHTRNDGVKITRPLQELVDMITGIAVEKGVVLTRHEVVMERAHRCATHLDKTLAGLQEKGTFHEFNQAYRRYRIHTNRQGKKVKPFGAVTNDLKRSIIRALVTSDNDVDLIKVEEAIRKEFPWFSKYYVNFEVSNPLE